MNSDVLKMKAEKVRQMTGSQFRCPRLLSVPLAMPLLFGKNGREDKHSLHAGEWRIAGMASLHPAGMLQI